MKKLFCVAISVLLLMTVLTACGSSKGPSCFVKVRVGCTTASGAWASPS